MSKSPEQCYPRLVNFRRTVISLVAAAALAPVVAHAEAPGREAFQRGQAALKDGDAAAARAAFEEAVRDSNGWLLPRLELAELAVQRRENVEQERAALLALGAQAADVPRVHRLLAELAELQGDDAAAATSWSEVIARMPYNLDLRARRAAVFTRLGRHEEAAADWERVVRGRPDDAALRMLYADALEGAGRFDEAYAQHEQSIHLQPGKESPVRRFARFLERRGDRRGAAAQHAKADQLRARPTREQRNLRPLLPSKR